MLQLQTKGVNEGVQLRSCMETAQPLFSNCSKIPLTSLTMSRETYTEIPEILVVVQRVANHEAVRDLKSNISRHMEKEKYQWLPEGIRVNTPC